MGNYVQIKDTLTSDQSKDENTMIEVRILDDSLNKGTKNEVK